MRVIHVFFYISVEIVLNYYFMYLSPTVSFDELSFCINLLLLFFFIIIIIMYDYIINIITCVFGWKWKRKK